MTDNNNKKSNPLALVAVIFLALIFLGTIFTSDGGPSALVSLLLFILVPFTYVMWVSRKKN